MGIIRLVYLYLSKLLWDFLFHVKLMPLGRYQKKRRGRARKIFMAQQRLFQRNYGKYGRHVLAQNREPSDTFVGLSSADYVRKASDPKVMAFYLPQFHAIPENDLWHGRGFTEWTNVTRTVPHFIGHNQPQLPVDVGFYDLSHPSVMYRQVELAKKYGIYGFCFHYYWFSGKRLLEKPLFNWLERPDLDLPFCLCWANENWSKRWDGGNREVLIEQRMEAEDDLRFFHDILPFFKDPRYVKVDNRPFLIIYRPHLFPKERIMRFLDVQRAEARKQGFDGVYCVTALTHGFAKSERPSEWGFDAGVEFPPHGYELDLKPVSGFVNPDFTGPIYDIPAAVKEQRYFKEADDKLFRTVFPSWDNSPRKAYSGAHVFQLPPSLYQRWLTDMLRWTAKTHPESERFLFVNAWNEWAEGAHLEPDMRYGYAYLQATKESLESLS